MGNVQSTVNMSYNMKWILISIKKLFALSKFKPIAFTKAQVNSMNISFFKSYTNILLQYC